MTELRPPHIVCAACLLPCNVVLTGGRHWDKTMVRQLQAIYGPRHFAEQKYAKSHAIQGFIDQYGNFYGRKAAMDTIKETGQQIDLERNGPDDTILYSEGLY